MINRLKQLSSLVAKKLSLKTVNNLSTVQPFNHSTAKRLAFTLAEVLITITIIGVVAAMTIPNLLTDINQRKYNSASGNFQRKLGEALRVMNGQNMLKGHATTMSFVNELGKNFKIVKICSKVEDCFPAKFSNSSDTVITTSTLKDASALGQNYGTETVGVQFVNGVRAIIAYNPKYTTQNNGDVVAFDKDDKNKTVSMRTNVLSIIFDVSEDDNNKISEDIFTKNTSFGGNDGPCVQIGTYCVKDFGTDYKAIACTEGVNTKYCGDKPSGNTNDFWAGAQKKCEVEEMRLPSLDELKNIYGYLTTDEYKGSLSVTGNYWSSSEFNATIAYYLDFSSGNTSYNGKSSQHGVLCLGN